MLSTADSMELLCPWTKTQLRTGAVQCTGTQAPPSFGTAVGHRLRLDRGPFIEMPLVTLSYFQDHWLPAADVGGDETSQHVEAETRLVSMLTLLFSGRSFLQVCLHHG
jgi:hypothetical protein